MAKMDVFIFLRFLCSINLTVCMFIPRSSCMFFFVFAAPYLPERNDGIRLLTQRMQMHSYTLLLLLGIQQGREGVGGSGEHSNVDARDEISSVASTRICFYLIRRHPQST